MQYHNNEQLLLRHYKTVGMHEGRQANNRFNPVAYINKCNKNLTTAFNYNFASYILYYLKEGYKETKNVDLSGKNEPKQIALCYTVVQEKEYKNVNIGRKSNGVKDIELDSELMAIAEYRSYINVTGNYYLHEWLHIEGNADPIFEALGVNRFSENTIKTTAARYATNWYNLYLMSKPHADAMFDENNVFIGISNPFVDYELNYIAQFDMFIPASENYVPDV